MTKPDLREIDKRIAEWHKSDSKLEIHEYLGMTQDEYVSWVIIPVGILLYANFSDETTQHEE